MKIKPMSMNNRRPAGSQECDQRSSGTPAISDLAVWRSRKAVSQNCTSKAKPSTGPILSGSVFQCGAEEDPSTS